jgi:hypothetical protein
LIGTQATTREALATRTASTGEIINAANPNRYWMSRSVAPALVTASDIMEFDLDSNPIEGKGRALYKER